LLRLLITLLGLAVLLLVILWVGQWTRGRIANLDRYTVALAEVECPPPPDQSLPAFLADVQYLGKLPERLHLLDEDLRPRLASAFAQHPEVEKVQEVEILPPRQIRIRLIYRTPVMIVTLTESKSGEFFVVDGQGVLLRRSIELGDLPTYATARMSAGPAGSPCSDPNVIAAARTAAFLKSYQAQLSVKKIEGDADNLILKGAWAPSVIWGHAPGEESSGEPAAKEKVRLLMKLVESKGIGANSDNTLDLRLNR
jgi:hypothetical protein